MRNNLKNEVTKKTKHMNGFAPAGKALGIVSVCLFWVPIIGFSLSIIGIVMSSIGFNMAKDDHNEEKIKCAQTGRRCSICGIVLGAIIFLALVIVLPIVLANQN